MIVLMSSLKKVIRAMKTPEGMATWKLFSFN
jgi:hypothetical protein